LITGAPSWRDLRTRIGVPWPALAREAWTAPWWSDEGRAAEGELSPLYERYRPLFERALAQAETENLSQESAATLVRRLEAGLSAETVAAGCVPPELQSDPDLMFPFTAATLIRCVVLAVGRDHVVEAGFEQFPLLWAYKWFQSRRAWEEVNTRGHGHKPGFYAALLAWCMSLADDGLWPSWSEGITRRAAGYLQGRVANRFPMTARRRRDDLLGQVAMTVRGRLGRVDPFDALAAALDGKWNIVPRAIRDDLARLADESDQSESETLEVVIRDREGDAEDPMPQPPELAAIRERLAALCSAGERNPRVAQIIRSALGGADSQREIAKDLGVSRETVRRCLASLDGPKGTRPIP
jgi:hypothetical protein